MFRHRLNLLALSVILLGGLTLAGPTPVSADNDNLVCCPGSGGQCCGRECKSRNDGSCEACSGFWSCLFM